MIEESARYAIFRDFRVLAEDLSAPIVFQQLPH